MVDLKNQYLKIKDQIDKTIINTIESSQFIGGPEVENFKASLEQYLGVKHVIPCANCTDALQISLMSLNLERGDEIIVPAFTYIAAVEVIALLGLKPILVDVNLDNFNILVEDIENKITSRTKAIIPIHLFGQGSNMEELLKISQKYNLNIIEDNAQALGAHYKFKDGSLKKLGTIGNIGCTSFFPSKNLGCYGDGGAIMTNDEKLAKKIKMIANHGQLKKYNHKIIGCNSRLDSIQASILNIKLNYFDQFNRNRLIAANYYSKGLKDLKDIIIPVQMEYSSHVYHQYTIRIKNNLRDSLREYLTNKGIPSMIYYPIPVYRQEAFSVYFPSDFELQNTEQLCRDVLSIPMHSELNINIQNKIINSIKEFFDV